jgi:signal transduction histidine kinase/ActR/RegA family two-component response regulator
MLKPEKQQWEKILFWTLASAVLLLLVTGLLLRALPKLPEQLGVSLSQSLIPVPYLDLVGIGLFHCFLYAAWKRWEIRRLTGSLRTRVDEAQSRTVEIQELTTLFEVSSQVSSLGDLEEVLDFIARTALNCLGADRSTVLLNEGGELVLRAAAGRQLEPVRGVRVPLGEGVAGWVAEHHKPLLLNSQEDVEQFLAAGHAERSIESALSVPLLFQDESLGVLNVSRLSGSGKPSFEERHLQLLSVFADYASSAINNLKMGRESAEAHTRLERSFRDLKRVQDQLIQAEKMSAVGQLISEVSHELNNPLTTALGYAQLVSKVNKDPEIAEYLDTIRDEGMRCQKIIRNLLDFSRKQKGDRVPVDLNEVVQNTLNLRRYQLGIDSIEVTLDLTPDLPMILADPTSLQQVLLNLLNNAHQALKQRRKPGRVRFTTRRAEGENGVVVVLEDNGPGIADEYLERVFDPFFTTKEKGKGTGLGLSVCRGIVEELGGRITAGTSEQGGALFSVDLPTGVPQSSSIVIEDRHDDELSVGGSVLIVDDEEKIRGMLERTLRLDAHRVRAVETGREALRAIEDGEWDIILVDLMMPEMTGIELYRRVRARSKSLADRFIFLTGVALTEEHRKFFKGAGCPVIQKPFRLEELQRVLRSTKRTDRLWTAGHN